MDAVVGERAEKKENEEEGKAISAFHASVQPAFCHVLPFQLCRYLKRLTETMCTSSKLLLFEVPSRGSARLRRRSSARAPQTSASDFWTRHAHSRQPLGSSLPGG
jgi:hypothetical protein